MKTLLISLLIPCNFWVQIMTPPALRKPDSVVARIYAIGGTAPYTYTWQNGTTDSTCTITSNGGFQFIVTVRDANNCISIDTLTIK